MNPVRIVKDAHQLLARSHVVVVQVYLDLTVLAVVQLQHLGPHEPRRTTTTGLRNLADIFIDVLRNPKVAEHILV